MAKKQEEQNAQIERRTETRSLQCKLSPEDLQSLGKQLARATQQKEEVEERKKEVSSQLKAEIDAHQATMKSVSQKLNQGFEYRPVDVDVILDYDAETVSEIRTDTNEEIQSRRMRADERQRDLPLSEDQEVIQEDDEAPSEEE